MLINSPTILSIKGMISTKNRMKRCTGKAKTMIMKQSLFHFQWQTLENKGRFQNYR